MSITTNQIRGQAEAIVRVSAASNPAPFWVVGVRAIDGIAVPRLVQGFGTRADAQDRLARIAGPAHGYVFCAVYSASPAVGNEGTRLSELALWTDDRFVRLPDDGERIVGPDLPDLHSGPVIGAVSAEAQLAHLDRLVPLHETFWSDLAQRRWNRRDDDERSMAALREVRDFMRKHWDPWFAKWLYIRPQVPPSLIEDFIPGAAEGLSVLRLYAAEAGIPTPDLGQALHGVVKDSTLHVSGDLVGAAGARGSGRWFNTKLAEREGGDPCSAYGEHSFAVKAARLATNARLISGHPCLNRTAKPGDVIVPEVPVVGALADDVDVIGLVEDIDRSMIGFGSGLFAVLSSVQLSLDDPRVVFYRETWEPLFADWTQFRDRVLGAVGSVALATSLIFRHALVERADVFRSALSVAERAAMGLGFFASSGVAVSGDLIGGEPLPITHADVVVEAIARASAYVAQVPAGWFITPLVLTRNCNGTWFQAGFAQPEPITDVDVAHVHAEFSSTARSATHGSGISFVSLFSSPTAPGPLEPTEIVWGDLRGCSTPFGSGADVVGARLVWNGWPTIEADEPPILAWPPSRFAAPGAEDVTRLSPTGARNEANIETDMRFWAETGYKPGVRLNPRDPQDRAMIPEWISIHDAVQAERSLQSEIANMSEPVIGWGWHDLIPGVAMVEAAESLVEPHPHHRAHAHGHHHHHVRPEREPEVHPVIGGPFGRRRDHEPRRPSGRWAALSPPVALSPPAGSGVTATAHLDPDYGLTVSLTGPNGMTYTRFAPLGGLVRNVAELFVADHAATVDAGETSLEAAQAAATRDVHSVTTATTSKVAGELLGAMLAEHAEEITGGWWDAIKHTAGRFKGEIEAGAAIAAGAAAGAALGPEAAPIAAKLAKSLVQAAEGNTAPIRAEAAAHVAQLKQRALSDPRIARAVQIAHGAVAKTASAYHVAHTLDKARAGHGPSIAAIRQLRAHADTGDPAAVQALSVATQIDNATPDGSASVTAPEDLRAEIMSAVESLFAGELPVVGWAPRAITHADVRSAAIAAVTEAQARHPGRSRALGYVRSNGAGSVLSFRDVDAADDWYGQTIANTPAFEYAAIFDPGDPTFPAPVADAFGKEAVLETVTGGLVAAGIGAAMGLGWAGSLLLAL